MSSGNSQYNLYTKDSVIKRKRRIGIAPVRRDPIGKLVIGLVHFFHFGRIAGNPGLRR